MKVHDTLKPAETLYESRFFEALHRADTTGRVVGKIRRQVRVRCNGECRRNVLSGTPWHDVGKLWIVDFYLWPHIVVEIDGHDINHERDSCLAARGLLVMHLSNDSIREMDWAVMAADEVLQKRRFMVDLKSYVSKFAADGCSRPELSDMGFLIQFLLPTNYYPRMSLMMKF